MELVQAIQIPSLKIASAMKTIARRLSALGHFGVGSKGGQESRFCEPPFLVSHVPQLYMMHNWLMSFRVASSSFDVTDYM